MVSQTDLLRTEAVAGDVVAAPAAAVQDAPAAAADVFAVEVFEAVDYSANFFVLATVVVAVAVA